ncbi:HEAT repeat domain-containing protein [Cupriavidus sp. CuC1]|uniref:HEAT repeat domain-containing protein n=1 Tax=Cupriavidus sp. CuC1 TaxID=3373131 RepID=UPI0037D2E6AE
MATEQEAIDALIHTLNNANHTIERVGAAEGLGIAGGERARAELIKVLTTARHAEVRAAAAKALGRATHR